MTKENKRFASSDVLSMFPTLVWKMRLEAELVEAVNEKILGVLGKSRDAESGQNKGWQSSQDLHELEELAELMACVRDAVRMVLRFLKVGFDEFEVTGCWANVNPQGADHKIHSHPNNFLSGVYYVKTPSGADTINFHDPRIQAGIIRPPVTELTGINTDQVVVKVENGTLLIFPSYLQHSVDANTSDQERVSVSFNLMFSSFTENLSKPLW